MCDPKPSTSSSAGDSTPTSREQSVPKHDLGGPVSFGDRLAAAALNRSRLCVGIDPHPGLLSQWGLPASVDGLESFTMRCVEAFGTTVALVKPQVAFFESYGSRGYAVLEKAIAALHEAGTLVLADAKRGDIGSTMAAYADAWLGETSPLRCDAVTASPYTGFGALEPVLDVAERQGQGVYVLAATSNPEAEILQSAQIRRSRSRQRQDDSHDAGDGDSVAQHIVDECAARNQVYRRKTGSRFGNVGVVVGATLGLLTEGSEAVRNAPDLSALNGPVLLPGVGAQGASADDVRRLTTHVEPLAFPNISRAILKHGPDIGSLQKAVEANAQDYPGMVLE
ncbi:orotidine-5'-phosphate decarboxylase [Corynebacterium parakroppenstedtii]|uniref:orotidine-5'-phosphate decarboxylase n=1 Tax=Corynebacterium parakroppenstedtii TaxID=2828363 RepID=UPI001C8E5EB1|nr:orotidine-5'-phosphate decarboxylase [Corynebacterium parakroppenstedtii]MBY0787728.1 orotidine-5'-phosphate decarboxylase [Corynebacterium parakroppenstedtii]MBY0796441.1 orotidine-5'-phosphate decarboxylase [Corynebacterium parakroppenstedtii]